MRRLRQFFQLGNAPAEKGDIKSVGLKLQGNSSRRCPIRRPSPAPRVNCRSFSSLVLNMRNGCITPNGPARQFVTPCGHEEESPLGAARGSRSWRGQKRQVRILRQLRNGIAGEVLQRLRRRRGGPSGQRRLECARFGVFSSQRDNSFFAVVVSFLLHPVDTIIRLTDDPAYRSHWAFLTAMVGV